MRLKSFSAPSMAEAMRQIREELGDDAVIVSTHRDNGDGSVRITAALETREAEDELSVLFAEDSRRDIEDTVGRTLSYHGTPDNVIQALLEAAYGVAVDEPTMALASALKSYFRFTALPAHATKRPIMLVGPPGVGKTVAAAKLATRAALAKRRAVVVSTDTVRAGGIEQLSAFTDILETDLHTAGGGSELRDILGTVDDSTLVIIDSSGTNPFSTAEMSSLAALIDGSDVEPVLVTACGGDPSESVEIAEAFRSIGAKRMLITRLDMARRLGSVLAAAAAGPLSFSEVSISPHVARGLTPLNSTSLARILMRDPG
ncbi:MAG: GTP-binding protein [Rhodospirillaceae bacterium]|nr:GTP-binding protein [Rhodospirillaceae bacterium]